MLGTCIKVNWKGSIEMVRVNIGILGISELKWTGMGKLTQMTIMSTTVARIPSQFHLFPASSTLATTILFSVSVSLFLNCRYAYLYHILDSTNK